MRALLSWLRELTPLAADPGDRASVVALASELDALGLVVEKTEWVGEGLDDVVVAKVLEIAAIEGADRIRRVVVDRGGDDVEVVCGAWNFEVGDLVAFAPVGSVLPNGMRMERRKMRGVVSNGMLCSGAELELSEDHAGILVLGRTGQPGGVELGTPLAHHLGFGPDVVFSLDVEPNRPDCLSMVGIARDLAARYGLPLTVPSPVLEETGPPVTELASVAIDEPDLCERLVGRVLTGIAPVPSPPLVQRRLLLSGMRPIGHVVDASNYVMLELGQPSHPYDLDALGGGGLRVRAAHPGETIVTLDGETRILGSRPARGGEPRTALDALICDANGVPVGIAGVMGGRSSEIAETTGRVLVEVARFDAVAVGRTARDVGLRTEGSLRFERGVDPEGLERAADRFCELVVAAARGAGTEQPAVARGRLDANPRPFERRRLRLRAARANGLLGLCLEPAEMEALLSPIGYEAAAARQDGPGAADGALELVVPPWRTDVRLEVDVIEDLARSYGYRRIPLSDRRSPYVGRLNEVQHLRRRLRRILSGLGAHEAWTGSIVDPSEQRLAGIDERFVELANPIAAEESVMRASLLAGMLRSLRHNAGHRNPWIRLFEVGDVFVVRPRGDGGGDPTETERLGLVLARADDDAAVAVAAWRVVAEALGIVDVEISQPGAEDPSSGDEAAPPLPGTGAADGRFEAGLAGLHPTRSGLLVVAKGPEALEGGESVAGATKGLADGAVLGAVGEVDPDVVSSFGLPHARVGWLELDVFALAKAPRRPALARPVSRYPSSDVDLAFEVDDAVPAARVEARIEQAAGRWCESVELFDVYRGEGLGTGRRSLAYRLRLCALDHTLTDAEVAEVRGRCIVAVEAALPATLRGS